MNFQMMSYKNSQDELIKRVDNLYIILQKNTNSMFYLAGNSISKTFLNKAAKLVSEKDFCKFF